MMWKWQVSIPVLLAHVISVTVQQRPPNKCVECTNYLGDDYYSFCPKEAIADLGRAASSDCNGPCFTKTDIENPNKVTRGCSTTQGLPKPLPPDGCYDWRDAMLCLCSSVMCNFFPMGISSGVPLDDHLQNLDYGGSANSTDPDEPLQCYQCINYDADGNYYKQCPKDRRVDAQRAYSGNCTEACFIRSVRDNDTLVVRGCTEDQFGLPVPLPADGCYDNTGETWCICRSSYCNGRALGQSSGVDFGAHLDDIVGIDPSEEEDGISRCYECVNYFDGVYYPQCPKDSRVRNAAHAQCNGTCFTRTFADDPEKVARGCTDTQYGMPVPLPPPGCYNRDGEVWCLCDNSRCNGNGIGTSSGVDFFEHLNALEEEIVEPDGQRRCYECINYDSEGTYYPQCAKNTRVRNAYLSPCNGTCFTHSYDYDDRLVARGCSDTQFGLPDPLPPDGCYTYYSSVWCVCSTSRCNGAAIGEPQNIELDAHLNNGGAQGTTRVSSMFGWLHSPECVLIAIFVHLGLRFFMTTTTIK